MSDAAKAKKAEATQEDAPPHPEDAAPAYEAGESSHSQHHHHQQHEEAADSAPPAHPPPAYPAPTIPLADGDPDEVIQVPFVVSHQSTSLKRLLTGKGGNGVRQRVTTRSMRRATYLERYAKDSAGNYAGTGAPAPDARMVYVASMDEGSMKQAQVDTAFGKEHYKHWTENSFLGAS